MKNVLQIECERSFLLLEECVGRRWSGLVHPWWETQCGHQLCQVRPLLISSMKHGQVAHTANNGGMCHPIPAVVPYKRCSQVWEVALAHAGRRTISLSHPLTCASSAHHYARVGSCSAAAACCIAPASLPPACSHSTSSSITSAGSPGL